MCMVWKSANPSPSFARIMAISLSLLNFNAVLSSRKRKKSHSNKSYEYGGVGMRVILLVARNSHIKQSGKVHCHDAENNPPNSIFHVIFTAFFLTDAVKCQCSNDGLVCPCGTNSWFTTVWMLKKQWACCWSFSKLVLTFLCKEVLCCST